MPTTTDILVGPQGDPDIARMQRAATWISIAAVSGISLIARDPTVFVLGGSMVIALTVWNHVANWNDPDGVSSAPSNRALNIARQEGAGYTPAA
jgi:hypothetical protein